tara:strand:- start:148 stop:423 length:276 start_codon:yes stop_codon:yes gene_type:complete
MKKILFLIFGLMSFTASANTNMQFLWSQKILGSIDGSTEMTYIQAYCVYDQMTAKKGTTFIYSYSGGTLVSVEQLRYPDINLRGVVPCYRD